MEGSSGGGNTKEGVTAERAGFCVCFRLGTTGKSIDDSKNILSCFPATKRGRGEIFFFYI